MLRLRGNGERGRRVIQKSRRCICVLGVCPAAQLISSLLLFLFAASGHPEGQGVDITCSDNPPLIGSHFRINMFLDVANTFDLGKDAGKLVKVRQPNTLHKPLRFSRRKAACSDVRLTLSTLCSVCEWFRAR